MYLLSEQGPGLGAAMIAAMGVTWFDSIEDCIELFVKLSEPIYPNYKNATVYKQIYSEYKQIYYNTSQIFLNS